MRWLVAWLVLALCVLCTGEASASEHSDQGEAYAHCEEMAAATIRGEHRRRSGRTCEYTTVGSTVGRYTCMMESRTNSDQPFRETGCTGNSSIYHNFPIKATCSARPPLSGGWSAHGVGGGCNTGCAYGPGTTSDVVNFSGKSYFSLAGASPTGGVCTYGEDIGETVTENECAQVNDLTMCITPQGKHCAASSSGKLFCWEPGEAGTKVSQNEAATKAPATTQVKPPATPPKNNGDWQPSGSGTVTESKGGSTTTYNVVNYTSNYGPSGSGGGAEGESGNGGGGDGGGEDWGTPGPGVGDVYQGTDKTVSSVFNAFHDTIKETPMMRSASAFFGGCNGGGQCPNETWDGGDFAGRFDLSQLCSGPLGTLLNYAGWVFLAAMGAVALRWSLL